MRSVRSKVGGGGQFTDKLDTSGLRALETSKRRQMDVCRRIWSSSSLSDHPGDLPGCASSTDSYLSRRRLSPRSRLRTERSVRIVGMIIHNLAAKFVLIGQVKTFRDKSEGVAIATTVTEILSAYVDRFVIANPTGTYDLPTRRLRLIRAT